MPVRKSTRLVTTSENVSRELGLLCPGGHDHRQIKSTWRDATGRRVNASEWCGGYSKQFAKNILDAFERQLKTEILDCFTSHGLGNDSAAQARRAALDDVPISIRQNLDQKRRKQLLDDVPLSIRRSLGPQQTDKFEEDKSKRRRHLLDDLPMSIKKQMETARQQPEEPDL